MIINVDDWPVHGATVHLTRYATGSTLIGDHADPDFEAVGTVIATPISGGESLIVATEHVPDRAEGEPEDPWAITPGFVMFHASELYRWTIEPAPGPGQAVLVAALIDARFVDPELIALAVRGTLRGLGVELIPHNWTPDADTVADCAGLTGVTPMSLTP